jgi:hypothetical protein
MGRCKYCRNFAPLTERFGVCTLASTSAGHPHRDTSLAMTWQLNVEPDFGCIQWMPPEAA